MKGLTLLLAMTAVLAFAVVGNAEEYEKHCSGSGGFRAQTGGCGVQAQTGGCGVSQRGVAPPRFSGDDIVPSPEPVNRTAAHRGARYTTHTVGKPTIHCNGVVVGTPVIVVPARVVPVSRRAVIGVPTNSGYFYSERRLGILGLRGVEVQMHQYGPGK